ncbi:alpha/beta fold hydrolase [Ancylobacter dichloromethanicus]
MMKLKLAAIGFATLLSGPSVAAAPEATPTTYHYAQVDGIRIFYREAGRRDAPTIVLLHGFPSSSRQYDALIPLLAKSYHVIAPDFSGLRSQRCAAAGRI